MPEDVWHTERAKRLAAQHDAVSKLTAHHRNAINVASQEMEAIKNTIKGLSDTEFWSFYQVFKKGVTNNA